MLKSFRNNNIIVQIITVLAVAGMMWGNSFAHPNAHMPSGGGSLFYWLTSALSPLMATIIAFVLMLVEGVLLTSILYRHKLIGQGNLFPLLFFVIAFSSGRPTLTPILLGTLFLILAIEQLLLTTTLLSIGLDRTFGAAACVGMATILCPTMVVFTIPVIISMFNYSLYNWRDWAMFILGFLAPWILVETYYWVNDELFYRNYLLLYTITDFHLRIGGSFLQWVVSIVFLLFIVWGIMKVVGMSRNRNINFNKNVTTLLLFSIGSLLLAGYSQLFPVATANFAIPFACCATYIFMDNGTSGFSKQHNELWLNLFFIATILFFVLTNWFVKLT